MGAKRLREGELPNAKAYAGKIKRLALSMMRHGYSFLEATAFIASAEGIKDDNRPGMARWFHDNLPKLEHGENYVAICEDCACCLGGKRYEAARQIFLEEPTLEKRIQRLIRTPLIVGYRGEIIDDKSFYVRFFPEQEYYRCSCLRFDKGQQEFVMPEGYCICCAGHIKHHIEKALGCPVTVQLVTSSLTTLGREGCRFRVQLV